MPTPTTHHSLDEARVRELLSGKWGLEYVAELPSTSTELMRRPSPLPHRHCLVAERQSEGRGRRGNRWWSLPGTALTFSLAWRFDLPISALGGLSLGVGAALLRALSRCGAQNLGLKWPNDLLLANRSGGTPGKLAGTLIETREANSSSCTAIIGIGVNLTAADDLSRLAGQPAAGLADATTELPARELVLARCLNALAETLPVFAESGFAALRSEWQAADLFYGRRVNVRFADGEILHGTAHGIDEDGNLLLETASGMRKLLAGEVSLRSTP